MSTLLSNLIERYPDLAPIKDDISRTHDLIIECVLSGGKLLLCGNGGSASDCDHIVGELLKDFGHPRPLPQSEVNLLGAELASNLQQGIPAISLPNFTGFLSAYGNDRNGQYGFAQLVYSLGKEGDLLIALTTSGNSANVLHAAKVANAKGMKVVGLTGDSGGKLVDQCTICLKVPDTETFRIQERHLPIYHCLCLMVEETLFPQP